MKAVPGVARALCCLLGGAPAIGWPADAAVAAATQPASREAMVVRVRLNTENKGDLFVERTAGNDFWVKLRDLKEMGFRDPQGAQLVIDGEPSLSLRSMPGVSFELHEKELMLDITADPQLLSRQAFGLARPRHPPVGLAPNGNSFFLNYAFNAAHDNSGSPRLGAAGELGWRWGDYLLLSDASTVVDGLSGKRRFVRLMSNVTHDDREASRRTVVGDFFTPTRELTSGINLGGVSLSKLYGLNPYFIQFPMQSVSGNVALPSDLEVFVDGQRIRSERLKPGEFELRDILAQGGARNVQLVLRDAFGRVQQLDYSFYFSDQPLRQGLHEYSYNLGAIRRSYGTQSNHYGPAAFSLFHRYGLTNAVTLGVRADGTKHFLNGGPTATVVLGGNGVLSGAAAASAMGGRRGAAALLSYTYQAQGWSAGASLRRDWNHYAALADPPLITNRKLEASVSASYHLGSRGTVSMSHSLLSTRDGQALSAALGQPYGVAVLQSHRRTMIGYSVPLVPGWAALTASISHVKDRLAGSRNEAFAGLTVFLSKDYSLASNYRGDKNRHSESVELTKRQPVGEGLGFTLVADRATESSADQLRLKSSVQYNAPVAILRADVGRNRDEQGKVSDETRVSVAGGVGYVDGTLSFGRPITGSFGIVKVGELSGVGVLVNGQRIGQTDAQGKIFVPTLGAYIENTVSLAAETLPIDYSVPAVTKKVSPALRSGAVITFSATKLQAFTGKLKTRQNDATRPVEFARIKLAVEGKVEELQSGRGGEFYVENLKAGTYEGTVTIDGKPCLFELVIARSTETFVDLGDVVCRMRP